MTAKRASDPAPTTSTLPGIVTGIAILLFVTTAGRIAMSVVERCEGQGTIDQPLLGAMPLDIALIAFGWATASTWR